MEHLGRATSKNRNNYLVSRPKAKKSTNKTIYKYVYHVINHRTGKESYVCQMQKSKKNNLKFKWSKAFENINDAAKAVDLKLISVGREPVNILKKK